MQSCTPDICLRTVRGRRRQTPRVTCPKRGSSVRVHVTACPLHCVRGWAVRTVLTVVAKTLPCVIRNDCLSTKCPCSAGSPRPCTAVWERVFLCPGNSPFLPWTSQPS